MNHRLSKFWWLWFVILFIQLGIEIGCTEQMKEYLLREGGVHENLQAFFAFSACVAALRAFRIVEGKWLKIWFFLGAVGSFFIAGEELSWGQWIFEWTTPAQWAEINDSTKPICIMFPVGLTRNLLSLCRSAYWSEAL